MADFLISFLFFLNTTQIIRKYRFFFILNYFRGNILGLNLIHNTWWDKLISSGEEGWKIIYEQRRYDYSTLDDSITGGKKLFYTIPIDNIFPDLLCTYRTSQPNGIACRFWETENRLIYAYTMHNIIRRTRTSSAHNPPVVIGKQKSIHSTESSGCVPYERIVFETSRRIYYLSDAVR